MEDMVSSTPSKVLSMHNNSHLRSKFKPKIRIVHIFAPEIIKTDAENFRELVQRLTGKPAAENKGNPKKKKKLPCRSLLSHDHANKTMQFEDVVTRSNIEEKIIKEEENDNIWGDGSSSSGNLFDDFKDFDGFIQDLSESSHHGMNVFDQVEDIHFSI
ncbi:hypothetical protein Ddye_031953 [Dipteronia dyeriana]|uniref:VQ domain-containing protein n=1 Tax=Dipteronia dyeriana TaxID=168575 RepID=A0AAD9TJY8_9ROSI|nr:hypothetical protein Ddye_031953 [Dipteronia dyeriana]